ncbi:hypothetical protein Salat_2657800 [Sesamum alatum]|uniref:DUF4283 domain-containing protein n=1 Tax=Sesamum alatum TaxID=300844 RepID=A0AAE2CAW5_9LAMI|nr:hypothetical protein Salat_2657800 [Sesamum alatum]
MSSLSLLSYLLFRFPSSVLSSLVKRLGLLRPRLHRRYYVMLGCSGFVFPIGSYRSQASGTVLVHVDIGGGSLTLPLRTPSVGFSRIWRHFAVGSVRIYGYQMWRAQACILNPVKGLEMKSLAEGRFLIRSNHIIDRNSVLEGCPWSFQKNTLILNSMGVGENPLQVDLNWCEFYVHIHDLPLSKMNLGTAMLIRNRLGRFRDMEMEESGHSWRHPLYPCRS